MTQDEETRWKALADRLRAEAERHSPAVDSWLYNGGTVLVLAATSAATFLPANMTAAEWLPRLLTGFAAFWVALERALTFGARWRFHTGMRARYRSLARVIDLYLAIEPNLTDEQRTEYLAIIRQEMSALAVQEAAVPGADATATSG